VSSRRPNLDSQNERTSESYSIMLRHPRAPIDPTSLRDPLERALADAMPAVFGGLSALSAGFTVVDLAGLPSSARLIVVYDAVIALLCLAARYAWRSSPAVRRQMYPLSMGIGLAFASNTIGTLWATRQMAYSAHLAVMVVAASAFFSSVPWIVAYDVAVGATWFFVAARVGTPEERWAHGLALALAAALAALIYLTRVSAYARVALLQVRDRRRGERLREALGRARSELETRKRVEDEEGKLREQLLQALKMDAVARLAGGVAHEVNNALASISTITGLMLEEERLDPVARDDLTSILEAAGRAAELTRKLLAVGRKGKYTTEVLDPTDLVDAARMTLADRLVPPLAIEVRLLHGDAKIEGDSAQIVQALRSLLVNAADAMPDGGMLLVQTALVTLSGRDAHARAVAAGQYVAFTVQDTGAGMDSETRKAAFDPFFTTKPFGEGAGLGLPMVYGTARTHGGSAEIHSARGRGTTVTLHVPCASEDAGHDTHETHDTAAPQSGPRRDLSSCSVLVVDDEAAVRGAARKILERMGLRVREAENGRRALEVHAAEGPFDLIVCDMVMPAMGGRELVSRLREKATDTRVLLVSGFAPDEDARSLLETGALGFLEKPFSAAALTRAVRAALSSTPPAASGTDP
jgi:signal transduction histidine kinase/ActR/RegA family two-component response regulator